LDIEAGVHGPFHTLREPIFHAHTKVGENILIAAGDIPQKRNWKNVQWWRNSTSGSNAGALHPLGTFVCVIMQNFSKIRQSVAEL